MKIATEVKKRIKYLRYGKIFDYSLFDDIENRQALFVALNRLVADKKIERYSKGKYFKTKKIIEKYGKDNLEKFIYFTDVDNKSRWEDFLGKTGLVLGNKLFNNRGLTTQNPFITEIGTTDIRPQTIKKDLTKILYVKIPVACTAKNKKILEFIDIVSKKKFILDLIDKEYDNLVYKTLKEINKKLFINIFSQYSNLVKISFIKEIIKYSKDLANSLILTLSPYQRIKNEFA